MVKICIGFLMIAASCGTVKKDERSESSVATPSSDNATAGPIEDGDDPALPSKAKPSPDKPPAGDAEHEVVPAKANIIVYDTPWLDSSVLGSVAGSDTSPSMALKFRTIKSDDFGYSNYRSRFKTMIARFANDSKSHIYLKLPGVPQFCELRSPTGIIPVVVSGATVSFELPKGAGIYYLKTNLKTEPNADFIESYVFWVDDFASTTTAVAPQTRA